MHNWSDLAAVDSISNAATAKSLQSCPTLRPHRQQSARLPHPCDSPGKNTGVGCHFLLQCMKVKSESKVAQLCLTFSDSMNCSLPGSSVHGISRQEYWSGVPLPSPISNASTINIYLSWDSGLYCGVMLQCSTKRKNQAAAHTSFSSKNKGEVRTLNWTGNRYRIDILFMDTSSHKFIWVANLTSICR